MGRGEWDEEGDGERNGRLKGVLERGGVGDLCGILMRCPESPVMAGRCIDHPTLLLLFFPLLMSFPSPLPLSYEPLPSKHWMTKEKINFRDH